MDNVPSYMWETLHRELQVPPRDQRGESSLFFGIKIWLLFDRNATWQKFAMSLYSCSLDGALRQLRMLKLLPMQGKSSWSLNKRGPVIHKTCKSTKPLILCISVFYSYTIFR